MLDLRKMVTEQLLNSPSKSKLIFNLVSKLLPPNGLCTSKLRRFALTFTGTHYSVILTVTEKPKLKDKDLSSNSGSSIKLISFKLGLKSKLIKFKLMLTCTSRPPLNN